MKESKVFKLECIELNCSGCFLTFLFKRGLLMAKLLVVAGLILALSVVATSSAFGQGLVKKDSKKESMPAFDYDDPPIM